MACAGALTSIVMTAAGAFIANGGLSEVFGGAPIAGGEAAAAGEGLVTVYTPSGEIFSMSTAEATASGLIGNTTNQAFFSGAGGLTDTLNSMTNSFLEFTAPMREAWTSMSTAPAAAGQTVFNSTVGTWGPKTAQFLSSVTQQTFTTAIQQSISWASQSLGGTGTLVAGALVGDPRILGGVFSAAQSYVTTANNFINAAENSKTYLDKTFTSMDQTITAGLTGVSNWVDGLGDDVSKLGETVNWENLSDLGSPGQLLSNMEANGTLGPMYDKLSKITIDQKTAQALGYNIVTSTYSSVAGGKTIAVTDLTKNVTLGSLGIDLNTLARIGPNLPPTLQKEIYSALGTLTPEEVYQVKSILNNTQPAIVSGQDLLDPQKLFATSYTTLTTPIRTASPGWRAIYENESGSINPELNHLGENLKGIIPDDLAIANAALGRSFLQVKGIQRTTTDLLATATSRIENLKDLPLLQEQTTYLPPGVSEFWLDYYGSDYGLQLGTGNYNTMVISDVIGFAAGYNSGQPLTDNTTLLENLNNSGAFDSFTQGQGIYATIQAFCSGAFGPTESMPGANDWTVNIPTGWAAAGTYGPFGSDIQAFEDAWINGIIPYTVLANVDIFNNYPDAKETYNNESQWQEQYGREYLNRQRMDLDVTDLPATDQTAISFAQSLPSYGTQTEFGGPAMWLERVANASSLGGQTVIAAMREGRNTKRLNDAGLITDGPISTQGLEYPGDLQPNQYTKAEAEALVIRT